jgi:hypothetical protein
MVFTDALETFRVAPEAKKGAPETFTDALETFRGAPEAIKSTLKLKKMPLKPSGAP